MIVGPCLVFIRWVSPHPNWRGSLVLSANVATNHLPWLFRPAPRLFFNCWSPYNAESQHVFAPCSVIKQNHPYSDSKLTFYLLISRSFFFFKSTSIITITFYHNLRQICCQYMDGWNFGRKKKHITYHCMVIIFSCQDDVEKFKGTIVYIHPSFFQQWANYSELFLMMVAKFVSFTLSKMEYICLVNWWVPVRPAWIEGWQVGLWLQKRVIDAKNCKQEGIFLTNRKNQPSLPRWSSVS